jgi:hypothetical protein
VKDSEESNELEESNKWELIRKTIVIFILNWNFFEKVKTHHSSPHMRNKQDKKNLKYTLLNWKGLIKVRKNWKICALVWKALNIEAHKQL